MSARKWERAEYKPGYRAPKGVSGDTAGEIVRGLKHPMPENLATASKKKTHPLHKTLWVDTKESEWAWQGRVEYCRKFIAHVVFVTRDRKGNELKVRAVEYIRDNDEYRWHHIEDICKSAELRDAYFEEVRRMREQVGEKIDKIQELMRD